MNSILPSELYQLIYGFADDFTKLRLHQVCRHLYGIKIHDTSLMQQIKKTMGEHGAISYTNARYSDCHMLAAKLSDFQADAELAKILDWDDDSADNIDNALYFLTRHPVNPKVFSRMLIDGRYYAIICDLTVKYLNSSNDSNNARIWYHSLLNYITEMDTAKMLEVVLDINYEPFWESLLEYLYSHGKESIYCDFYLGGRYGPNFLPIIINAIIQYNIDSVYPMVYVNHRQQFINSAIEFTSIPAMRYIAKQGQPVSLNTDMRSHDKMCLNLIVHHLIHLMDDVSIAKLAVCCIKKGVDIEARYKNKMDSFYFGYSVIIACQYYGQELILSKQIYQDYLNDDNFDALITGIIEIAEEQYPISETIGSKVLAGLYRLMNADQRARLRRLSRPDSKLLASLN